MIALHRFAPRALAARSSIARLTLALLVGCGGTAVSPAPSPTPATDPASVPRTAPSGPTPLVQGAWPIRTREHVDLWLHGYALLTNDTTLVPYFRRGYRDRMLSLRRQRGVTSQLDAVRGQLGDRLAANPRLATGGQFVALYFGSWDQLRHAVDVFVRAGGNPGASNDPATRQAIAILASSFGSAAERDWLRLFTEALDDESRSFYHDYWTAESRARAPLVAHVDSLWQRLWRPALQRYLNNTQHQNGEMYLSLPLGGEGRTIQFGKQENVVAVAMPETRDQSEAALYVFAHEVVGQLGSSAIQDNTTPAEQRSGATSRYEQAAAVRGGALLIERTLPSLAPGYMRYYLQAAGQPNPPTDPRAAFVAQFSLPGTVLDAITRQLDVILGGI